MKSNYDRFLDKLLQLDAEHADLGAPGGYRLGWHSPVKNRAALYDVEHSPISHDRLRRELDSTSVRYRMIAEKLGPGETTSNVQLLDIDI